MAAASTQPVEHLLDSLAVQLCSVVRSEARHARAQPSRGGIPPNAIAVSVLNEAYSKACHNTVLPDLVRGLGLAKTSLLLRDKRMAGCVSVQTDDSNNQLMIWPSTRGPCACARDIPKRVAAHSDATWAELRRAERLGRAERQADRGQAHQSGWRAALPTAASSHDSLTRKTPPRSPSASPVTVTCDTDEMAGRPPPRSLMARFEDVRSPPVDESFSYFHEQPPRLRAVSAPHLSKAVYRPRHLRPVEAKEPYRLWSSTAPPLGPGCIPACVASICPA